MTIKPILEELVRRLDSELEAEIDLNDEYRAQQLAQEQAAFERWWRPDTPENRQRLEESYTRRVSTGPYVRVGYTP